MSTPTANYGWAKPAVGGDGDAWGGELNASLDGIDSTVKSVSNAIPLASSTTPNMDGTGAVGTGTTWARADHVHPVDTSRYAASNPSGYQTAAQVTAVVPIASSITPVMDGTATIGVDTGWAHGDHVHPTDTSRYAATNPSGFQTGAQVTASLAPYAPLASPTFTGTPSMPTGTTGVTQTAGNNSTALATTAYVDVRPLAMNDNRIINGDMRIDQRNNGASGTAAGYTVDRWNAQSTVASKYTWGRNLNASASAVAFPYYLGVSSSSSYASAATDGFYLLQPIEADMISDFAWGTSNAQPVTLSFWALSSLTGTFSGSIQNYAYTRSYPFTFSLPTAIVWTKIVITIPGDTVGTWVMSGNGGSLRLNFDLGSGATYRGPANAWATTSNPGYLGATGAVSIVATNGAGFYLTGVKLEIGSIATPFNRQSLAKSLADCQRYFYNSGGFNIQAFGYSSASSNYQIYYQLPVTMRASPSIIGASFSGGSNSTYVTNFMSGDLRTCVVQWSGSAGASYATWTVGNFNAEL